MEENTPRCCHFQLRFSYCLPFIWIRLLNMKWIVLFRPKKLKPNFENFSVLNFALNQMSNYFHLYHNHNLNCWNQPKDILKFYQSKKKYSTQYVKIQLILIFSADLQNWENSNKMTSVNKIFMLKGQKNTTTTDSTTSSYRSPGIEKVNIDCWKILTKSQCFNIPCSIPL